MRDPTTNHAAIMFLICACPIASAGADDGSLCSYDTYAWNVEQRAAVDRARIEKPRAELSEEEEVDASTGCSVCEQDQVWVELDGVPPVRICRVLAADIEDVLRMLRDQGFPLEQLEGYRPGRTRGEVDERGNRTSFSNHAYGIAIDINPHLNGLYTDCIEFGPGCRLIRGGPWRPGHPGTLSDGDAAVRALEALGLRWGGSIRGRQKDYMHFSPSGY